MIPFTKNVFTFRSVTKHCQEPEVVDWPTFHHPTPAPIRSACEQRTEAIPCVCFVCTARRRRGDPPSVCPPKSTDVSPTATWRGRQKTVATAPPSAVLHLNTSNFVRYSWRRSHSGQPSDVKVHRPFTGDKKTVLWSKWLRKSRGETLCTLQTQLPVIMVLSPWNKNIYDDIMTFCPSAPA